MSMGASTGYLIFSFVVSLLAGAFFSLRFNTECKYEVLTIAKGIGLWVFGSVVTFSALFSFLLLSMSH